MVFVSYSHKDKRYFDELQVHLKPLVREKDLVVWDDNKIKTGDLWKLEIKNALAQSKAAILLVSPDFLASEFIIKHELQPLLKAAKTKGLTVLPVILSHSSLELLGLAEFKAVNDISKPLKGKSRTSRDAVWVKLAKEIKSILTSQNQVEPLLEREAPLRIVSRVRHENKVAQSLEEPSDKLGVFKIVESILQRYPDLSQEEAEGYANIILEKAIEHLKNGDKIAFWDKNTGLNDIISYVVENH